VVVPVDDPILLEADDDFTRITTGGGHPLLVCRTLGSFAETLPSPPLLRLDRSLMVNLERVETIEVSPTRGARVTLRGRTPRSCHSTGLAPDRQFQLWSYPGSSIGLPATGNLGGADPRTARRGGEVFFVPLSLLSGQQLRARARPSACKILPLIRFSKPTKADIQGRFRSPRFPSAPGVTARRTLAMGCL